MRKASAQNRNRWQKIRWFLCPSLAPVIRPPYKAKAVEYEADDAYVKTGYKTRHGCIHVWAQLHLTNWKRRRKKRTKK